MDQTFKRGVLSTMPFELIINGEHVHQPVKFSQTPQLNDDIMDWCRTELKGAWCFTFLITEERHFHMFFELENDRLFFKMRWF
jgi:hypothetical protein